MTLRRVLLLLAAVAGSAGAQPPDTRPSGPPPAAGGGPPRGAAVQVGVDVAPDTVTVGEAFVVSVRVRAPLGAAVQFPPGPDSMHVLQAIDPPDVRTSGDTAAVYQTAR